MYAQNMYQVLLGSTRYRRVYVPKTSSPPTQTAGTQGFHPLNWSPLWNQWAQNIQDVSRHTFDLMIIFQHLKLNLNEVKFFFFRRTSPSHSTQHYQDIIIDGGGDQGCGENEGRDVGGQASSDWGCCLPTFSLLLHIIAWHPLVLHGIADTACDRGCVRCPIKSQLPILGRSKTLR